MNISQKTTVAIIINFFKQRGYINAEDVNRLYEFLTNTYKSVDKCTLYMIKKYNIKYKDFPYYIISDYHRLAKVCKVRPQTIKEIFTSSFHEFSQVIKYLTMFELVPILYEAKNLTKNEVESILLSKQSELRQRASKVKPENNETIITM